jgi:hypothetical protein
MFAFHILHKTHGYMLLKESRKNIMKLIPRPPSN